MDKYTEETVTRVKEAFKDHVATITECGHGITIIDWSRPSTNCYAIRYIFDNNKIYISGDLGEAIFRLTWKAAVHSFNDVHFDYFHEKLQAISQEADYEFNSEKAIAEIKYQFQDSIEDFDNDELNVYNDLIEAPNHCNDVGGWKYWLNTNQDWMNIDVDGYEWLYDCGNVYSFWFVSYLVGLQMISEQIMESETND